MGAPSSHQAIASPSAWVERFVHLIGEGEVLDLACGSGRHARCLASHGRRVLAVDKDESALTQAAGPGIEVMQLDLESPDFVWPFAAQRFAAVVVTNYLHRPLLLHIVNSLADEGVLIYETFAAGNGRFGKPSNPDFLLQPGELLRLCSGLKVLAFEDGYVSRPKPAMVQRICAGKSVGIETTERWRLD